MSLRDWIAKKLSPETFAKADRYEWVHSELHESYHWLGEFGDIAAFIEWLLEHEHNSWRGIAEPPTRRWPWHGGVPEFREQLRRRKPAK